MNHEWSETFTGSTFRWSFMRPCVYGWFRGEQCLYIGASSTGLARIITHNIVNVVEPILDVDTLRFIWFNSINEYTKIFKLESELIEHYDPTYNRNAGYHPVQSNLELQTRLFLTCGKPFQQRKWYQKICRRGCKQPKRELSPERRRELLLEFV